MSASASNSNATPFPGWEAFTPIELHIGAVIILLVAGGIIWLADGYIAERADAQRDFEYGQFGLPDFERERLGRDEVLERSEKTARGVGKGLVVGGAVLGLILLVRLWLT